EATLMIGENTVSLAPGKGYDISLEGIGYFATYYMSWENADVAMTVAGEDYVSGTETTYYFDIITLINNGSEAVEVVITLIDPNAQANTAAKLAGKFAVNFPMQGLYELTFTPDAEGFTGTLELVDNNMNTYSGTYTYAINAFGGVVFYKNGEETSDILISFDYWDNLTFQCPGLRMPATLEPVADGGDGGDDVPAGPAYDDAITGEDGVYSVDVDADVWDPYVIGYTASVAGTYVISTADGETNAWIDGWYYNDGWGDWDREQMNYIEGEGTYSFYLAEGETIYFWVSSNDSTSDVIDVVITLQEADGGDDDQGGDAPAAGVYADAIMGEDGVYTVNIENVYGTYVIGYTATEAGTYVLSTADSETNAWIDGWYYNDGWGAWDREWANYIEGSGSYSFDLAAGKTIYFWVSVNSGWDADVIDLVISAQ
ncbi:MAG: hypothetical protein IJX13_01460, partial [Clostridia bacterium]|nr:hypothetical protein [Clostridia bacterium]